MRCSFIFLKKLFHPNKSCFSVAGVDLYSTISMFLGLAVTSVFLMALIYCIR